MKKLLEERTGNSMSSSFDLSIAPDPASNLIKVKFLSAFSGSITVFNTAGKPVLSSLGLEQQTELTMQVRHLPTGVYYLMASPLSGQYRVARFTVIK